MKKVTHLRYKDYPEQPYISPERDLKAWENTPEKFPYAVVERKQMQRLEEGILPGHIVMLWRIHFGNFTNETFIPQYFEYRYGVDSEEVIKTLLEREYIAICGAKDSLPLLNMAVLKRILAKHKLETKGKKEELLRRAEESIQEKELSKEFTLRKYMITSAGAKVLEKYEDIIQKHGPKM